MRRCVFLGDVARTRFHGVAVKPKRNESDQHPLPRPVSSRQLLGCATENRHQNWAGCAYPFENPFYDKRSLLLRSVISLFAAGTTIVTGLVEKRFTLLLQPFFYAFILFHFNVFQKFHNFSLYTYTYISLYIYRLFIARKSLSFQPMLHVSRPERFLFFFFFYVPIVSRHRTISLDEQFIFPLYRLALSCNYKYRSILDETSNAIRIEEIVKCWHAVSKLPAFRRRKTR